jgi:hypothetical protein
MNAIRNPDGVFINTSYFKEEADRFIKHGTYCDAPEGSYDFKEYWDEQSRRCTEGYEVGGVKITGHHYNYLNFSQIQLTDESELLGIKKGKRSKSATKKTTFPDFWDGDYNYFWAVDIGRYGIEEDEYKKLNLGVKIKDLDGGKNICVSKARRKGFSFKNGSIVDNTYVHQRNATSVIGAYLTEYLYPKGTMTMFNEYNQFKNKHCPGFRRRRLKNDNEFVRCGFTEKINGAWVDSGRLNTVIATSFFNNAGAARGKDATLILLEEAGKFPNLKEAYVQTLDTIKDGVYMTGQILIFGTGGGEDSQWEDFEELFYDWETYDMLPFENIWDDEDQDTCSFFFPEYQNLVGFIDEQGNSKIEQAISHGEVIRENKKSKSRDPKAVDRYSAERPNKPREAFLRINQNIFPVKMLNDHLNYLKKDNKFRHVGVAGEFTYIANKLKFVPNDKLEPIFGYKRKVNTSKENSDGAVVMIQAPYRKDGVVPRDLYYICVDTYAYDEAEEGSLGVCYVMKQPNRFSQPDDMIVAHYVARPKTLDDFSKVVFELAEYYNAEVGLEWERCSSVIDYAKRFKKIDILAGAFNLAFDEKLKTSNSSTVKFGMRIGSGKDDTRKNIGLGYIRDWLLQPIAWDGNGNVTKLNLHNIMDIGLVEELIKYGKGNFDRVSALLVGMFFRRELAYLSVDINNDEMSNKISKLRQLTSQD